MLTWLQVFHVVLNRTVAQSKHIPDITHSILLRPSFRINFCTTTCAETCQPQDGGRDFYCKQPCHPDAFHSAVDTMNAKIHTSDIEREDTDT